MRVPPPAGMEPEGAGTLRCIGHGAAAIVMVLLPFHTQAWVWLEPSRWPLARG